MALYYHKARALSTLLFRPFAGEHGDGAVEWELGADKHAAPDEKNASRGRSRLNSGTDDRCGALAVMMFQVLKMRILDV